MREEIHGFRGQWTQGRGCCYKWTAHKVVMIQSSILISGGYTKLYTY